MARLGALWGLGGVAVLLIYAIARLMEIGLDSFAFDYRWYHWLVLIVNVAFMAYSEGYKGFQKAYSPRLAARLRYIRDYPTLSRSALAPLFGMGYFHATRRRLISTYAMTAAIIVFIYIAHQLAQPWRGILDIGVVVGLSWGLISILIYSWQALTWSDFPYSPEVP